MLDIVVATRNRHKLRELRGLLNVPGIRWHSLEEFRRLPPAAETGRTFDENAIKKARVVARATRLLALADDSGLEVEALGGSPGVQSARFAKAHGNDRANNTKLLRMLKGRLPRTRRAQYRCSLALADSSRIIAITRGMWRGRIATAPRGHRGFGYDPIFLVPRLGKTVGQLPTSMKQRLSHRAIAARHMRTVLRRLIRANERRRAGSAGSRPGRARVA